MFCYFSAFFRKKGVCTLSLLEMFYYIVDPLITKENKDTCWETLQQKVEERGPSVSKEQIQDENCFMNTYLPRSFGEVSLNILIIFCSAQPSWTSFAL